MEHHGEGDEHDADDGDAAEDVGGEQREERVVAHLPGWHNSARVVDHQRQAAVHRQRAEGDDQHRESQADGEDAVDQAEHGTEGDAQSGGEERIEPVADGEGGDDGGEVEHPADRQIDLAHRQEEDHAQREDADEGVAGRQVEQVVGVDEGRLDRPDEGDEQAEGDDDAELLGSRRWRRSRGWGSSRFVASLT